VAIDADSVPGLPQVLGFPPGDDRFLAGMAELKDGGWSLDDEGGWLVVDLQGGTLQVAGGMVGTAGIDLMVVEASPRRSSPPAAPWA
jgi:hypothetical protein